MGRRITNIRWGDDVSFLGKRYIVKDVYSYIAYLERVSDYSETICVNLGDLVMAGLEPAAANLFIKPKRPE